MLTKNLVGVRQMGVDVEIQIDFQGPDGERHVVASLPWDKAQEFFRTGYQKACDAERVHRFGK